MYALVSCFLISEIESKLFCSEWRVRLCCCLHELGAGKDCVAEAIEVCGSSGREYTGFFLVESEITLPGRGARTTRKEVVVSLASGVCVQICHVVVQVLRVSGHFSLAPMASVGKSLVTEDREDDGPTAVRDFPAGCVSVPRHLQVNTNRPVEATNRERKLPDDFSKKTPREQYFERRDLFARLLTYYKDSRRPDLVAMKQMNIDSSSFKFEEFGHVPGVEVGATFRYRAEMYVVGLHRMEEAGIACVNVGNETIACSVVLSDGYKENIDEGDVIYYSGHGGNDEQRVGKREDQELRAGNLGLLNSFKQGKPVRVIRGRKTRGPYKIYSYDGLYDVTEHAVVAGNEGHKVYRFKLVRQDGQPPLDKKKSYADSQRRNR